MFSMIIRLCCWFMPCSEGFPPSTKTNTPHSNLARIEDLQENQDWCGFLLKCWIFFYMTGWSFEFFWVINVVIIIKTVPNWTGVKSVLVLYKLQCTRSQFSYLCLASIFRCNPQEGVAKLKPIRMLDYHSYCFLSIGPGKVSSCSSLWRMSALSHFNIDLSLLELFFLSTPTCRAYFLPVEPLTSSGYY